MKIGSNHLQLRASGRTARRVVEKPHAASVLREEIPRQPAPSTARAERRGLGRMSRFDTNFAGSADRRGTESRFVAQVLGQILGSGADGALLATRAYARSNREQKETRLVRVL